MPTATELVVQAQLDDLIEIAKDQTGWSVIGDSPITFRVGLPASDGSMLWLRCDADRYPTLPPIWRWCDERGQATDLDHLTPKEGKSAFFHPNGVICAPWNRLAYQAEDKRGPHGNWIIGDWTKNRDTGQCTTLAGMVTRIAIELRCRFDGRKAERRNAA